MRNLNVTSLSNFVSALGAYYGEYGIIKESTITTGERSLVYFTRPFNIPFLRAAKKRYSTCILQGPIIVKTHHVTIEHPH